MPELAFYRHGEELLRVALGDRTEIGRSPDCDVSLPDPALSRLQAVVERRGEAFHLLDRSGRGTRVAGREVPEALRKALATDPGKVRGWLQSDPMFDGLKGTPEYDELAHG